MEMVILYWVSLEERRQHGGCPSQQRPPPAPPPAPPPHRAHTALTCRTPCTSRCRIPSAPSSRAAPSSSRLSGRGRGRDPELAFQGLFSPTLSPWLPSALRALGHLRSAVAGRRVVSIQLPLCRSTRPPARPGGPSPRTRRPSSTDRGTFHLPGGAQAAGVMLKGRGLEGMMFSPLGPYCVGFSATHDTPPRRVGGSRLSPADRHRSPEGAFAPRHTDALPPARANT